MKHIRSHSVRHIILLIHAEFSTLYYYHWLFVTLLCIMNVCFTGGTYFLSMSCSRSTLGETGVDRWPIIPAIKFLLALNFVKFYSALQRSQTPDTVLVCFVGSYIYLECFYAVIFSKPLGSWKCALLVHTSYNTTSDYTGENFALHRWKQVTMISRCLVTARGGNSDKS